MVIAIGTNGLDRHNPIGKVFSKEELQGIGDLCVKHNIIILSDEVWNPIEALSGLPYPKSLARFTIDSTTRLSLELRLFLPKSEISLSRLDPPGRTFTALVGG